MLASGVIERQILLQRLFWICLGLRLMYLPYTDFKHRISQMSRTLRWRTSFILSSQSWETGSLLPVVQGQLKCLMSFTSDSFLYPEERYSTSLTVRQKRKYIFGNPVKSFRFHYELALIFFKQCENIFVIILFCIAIYSVVHIYIFLMYIVFVLGCR